MQRFLKKWGGGCKYNTTICYYFCVEKAIDTRSQRSSETFQKGGGGGLQTFNLPSGSARAEIGQNFENTPRICPV